MILPQVLWDDPFRTAGIQSYSGTTVSGFDPANALDWRDFTAFRPDVGAVTYLVSEPLAASKYIDSAAGWFVPGINNSAFELEYENGAGSGVYVSLGILLTATPTARQLWATASAPTTVPSGRRLRWKMTIGGGGCDVRILTCGPVMNGETGQWEDIAPPVLTSGLVQENVIAVNGSIIARNVRRYEKDGKIRLTLLTPEWVRATWEPFVQHAVRYPFWYRWNPTGYATDIGLSAASEIAAPRNMKPPPRMSVEMPIRILT